jgi:K+/H+ antiporter YhaU regulatory subunit KhtT
LIPGALITFLLVVFSSIIIVRIGTVALQMTGLSKEVAAFQAQSAFSGVGFTTSESEYVVSHPVRRRIIRILMLLGSAGITSAMASLILTYIGQSASQMLWNTVWITLGLIGLFFFSRSKLIDRAMSKVIAWALNKWTSIKIMDYEQVLGLSRGYSISILRVRPGSWLEGRSLSELKLDEEGVLVLGVYRNTKKGEIYVGAPRGDFVLKAGDRVICYGPEDILETLPERLRGPLGDVEHEFAVSAQKLRNLRESKEAEELEVAIEGNETKEVVKSS